MGKEVIGPAGGAYAAKLDLLHASFAQGQLIGGPQVQVVAAVDAREQLITFRKGPARQSSGLREGAAK
jgi:hypothetical protein